MSGETDWPAIIIALGGLITSTTAAVVSVYGLRKSAGNSVKLDEVKKATDGLSTTAQDHAREAGQAVGEAKGRADMVAEQGADALARERGRPGEPPVSATVETAVVRALDTVASKSLDKVAGAVADKVAEAMEKKP